MQICITAYFYCVDSIQYCQNDSIYRVANGTMVTVNVINNTTGISQTSGLNSQIAIYPNPNNGNFTIETNATEKQTIQVYDVNGRVVLTQLIHPSPSPSTEGNKTSIDASRLAEGVYNLSIISNEGIVNKRLVIVR